ncbi:hypothetical protein BB559_000790 [Furculomyces boomerangus]|uniref:C17orf113 probable zinc finger domain-containing protein n=1 Tax=Furculomyces boomerangus TaxID=61424 RepID=A0A2T9Z453_9FUNG|nr:hypothetical protein BB559_000790 [Furculomyces boomerangus]
MNNDNENIEKAVEEIPRGTKKVAKSLMPKGKRRFNLWWLKDRSWLTYDQEKNVMRCTLCISSKRSNQFAREGSRNFKTSALVDHEKSNDHQLSISQPNQNSTDPKLEVKSPESSSNTKRSGSPPPEPNNIKKHSTMILSAKELNITHLANVVEAIELENSSKDPTIPIPENNLSHVNFNVLSNSLSSSNDDNKGIVSAQINNKNQENDLRLNYFNNYPNKTEENSKILNEDINKEKEMDVDNLDQNIKALNNIHNHDTSNLLISERFEYTRILEKFVGNLVDLVSISVKKGSGLEIPSELISKTARFECDLEEVIFSELKKTLCPLKLLNHTSSVVKDKIENGAKKSPAFSIILDSSIAKLLNDLTSVISIYIVHLENSHEDSLVLKSVVKYWKTIDFERIDPSLRCHKNLCQKGIELGVLFLLRQANIDTNLLVSISFDEKLKGNNYTCPRHEESFSYIENIQNSSKNTNVTEDMGYTIDKGMNDFERNGVYTGNSSTSIAKESNVNSAFSKSTTIENNISKGQKFDVIKLTNIHSELLFLSEHTFIAVQNSIPEFKHFVNTFSLLCFFINVNSNRFLFLGDEMILQIKKAFYNVDSVSNQSLYKKIVNLELFLHINLLAITKSIADIIDITNDTLNLYCGKHAYDGYPGSFEERNKAKPAYNIKNISIPIYNGWKVIGEIDSSIFVEMSEQLHNYNFLGILHFLADLTSLFKTLNNSIKKVSFDNLDILEYSNTKKNVFSDSNAEISTNSALNSNTNPNATTNLGSNQNKHKTTSINSRNPNIFANDFTKNIENQASISLINYYLSLKNKNFAEQNKHNSRNQSLDFILNSSTTKNIDTTNEFMKSENVYTNSNGNKNFSPANFGALSTSKLSQIVNNSNENQPPQGNGGFRTSSPYKSGYPSPNLSISMHMISNDLETVEESKQQYTQRVESLIVQISELYVKIYRMRPYYPNDSPNEFSRNANREQDWIYQSEEQFGHFPVKLNGFNLNRFQSMILYHYKYYSNAYNGFDDCDHHFWFKNVYVINYNPESSAIKLGSIIGRISEIVVDDIKERFSYKEMGKIKSLNMLWDHKNFPTTIEEFSSFGLNEIEYLSRFLFSGSGRNFVDEKILKQEWVDFCQYVYHLAICIQSPELCNCDFIGEFSHGIPTSTNSQNYKSSNNNKNWRLRIAVDPFFKNLIRDFSSEKEFYASGDTSSKNYMGFGSGIDPLYGNNGKKMAFYGLDHLAYLKQVYFSMIYLPAPDEFLENRNGYGLYDNRSRGDFGNAGISSFNNQSKNQLNYETGNRTNENFNKGSYQNVTHGIYVEDNTSSYRNMNSNGHNYSGSNSDSNMDMFFGLEGSVGDKIRDSVRSNIEQGFKSTSNNYWSRPNEGNFQAINDQDSQKYSSTRNGNCGQDKKTKSDDSNGKINNSSSLGFLPATFPNLQKLAAAWHVLPLSRVEKLDKIHNNMGLVITSAVSYIIYKIINKANSVVVSEEPRKLEIRKKGFCCSFDKASINDRTGMHSPSDFLFSKITNENHGQHNSIPSNTSFKSNEMFGFSSGNPCDSYSSECYFCTVLSEIPDDLQNALINICSINKCSCLARLCHSKEGKGKYEYNCLPEKTIRSVDLKSQKRLEYLYLACSEIQANFSRLDAPMSMSLNFHSGSMHSNIYEKLDRTDPDYLHIKNVITDYVVTTLDMFIRVYFES